MIWQLFVTAAHLLVLPPGAAPFTVELADDVVQVGSAPSCSVRVADPDVEPVHAEIRRDGDGFQLVRKGATLAVNGSRVRQHALAPGDLVLVGRTALSFRAGPPPRAERPRGQPADALAVLGRLYEFSRRISSGVAFDGLAEQMLGDVIQLTSGDRGSIVLFDAAGSAHPFSPAGAKAEAEQSLSRTALARIQADRRPLLWVDVGEDVDLQLAPSLRAARVRSLMGAPIEHADRLLGVLYVSKAEGTVPFAQADLDLLTLYARLSSVLLADWQERERLAREAAGARAETRALQDSAVIGSSPPMALLLRDLAKVAATDLPVLIQGETGTGKELVAREVHRRSPRAKGPFVAVNCGAIPEPLLESELFGHVKGAFTDARADRVGLVRAAHGGTLFLDEIGDMPSSQQAKLLRVLQDRKVIAVGGDQPEDADFRLICATHRDLRARIAERAFREDLYFRVAGVVLAVPPLRDRGDDPVALAEHFLERHRTLLGRPEARLSAEAITAIREHGWPGNVRELEHAVRRAVALCEGPSIGPSELGIEAGERPRLPSLADARDRYLKAFVQEAVERFGGNRTAAAEALGVTVRTVFKYLEEV